jgi:hypothetical protein
MAYQLSTSSLIGKQNYILQRIPASPVDFRALVLSDACPKAGLVFRLRNTVD